MMVHTYLNPHIATSIPHHKREGPRCTWTGRSGYNGAFIVGRTYREEKSSAEWAASARSRADG